MDMVVSLMICHLCSVMSLPDKMKIHTCIRGHAPDIIMIDTIHEMPSFNVSKVGAEIKAVDGSALGVGSLVTH